jgi:hypothetical protein
MKRLYLSTLATAALLALAVAPASGDGDRHRRLLPSSKA